MWNFVFAGLGLLSSHVSANRAKRSQRNQQRAADAVSRDRARQNKRTQLYVSAARGAAGGGIGSGTLRRRKRKRL